MTDDTLSAAIMRAKPNHPANTKLEWIRTEFNLPKDLIAQCSQHFLRVWEGSMLLEQVHDGTIEHFGIAWMIHWQSTPAVCRQAQRVACSFRVYEGKFYVVAKVWKGEDTSILREEKEKGE